MTDAPHILLLQGPLGPFFGDLACSLHEDGAIVHRVCINAGDRVFAVGDYIVPYTGTPEAWEEFLEAYISEHNIKTICLYGDSRHYHSVARDVGSSLNVPVLCLEEGYLRPGYVTAEWGGNNVNSPLMVNKTPRNNPECVAYDVGQTFWRRTWFGIVYYQFKLYHGFPYRYHLHHRPGASWDEMFKWIYSGICKAFVGLSDYSANKFLNDFDKSNEDERLFFVPLQVASDSQIIHHSRFENVEEFIVEIIEEFSKSRKTGDHIVFKHHPIDRGFKNYRSLIANQSKLYGIKEFVHYGFDLDMEEIFAKAIACITINSTVGMQAVEAGIPCKVLAPCIYGHLTSKAELSEFIQSPACATQQDSCVEFYGLLKRNALVGGDFYKNREIVAGKISKFLLRKR